MTTWNEKKLREFDQKHVWHPCSQMQDYEAYPAIPIVRGEGVWLYTAGGRKILDAISSWWVNLLGHGHPEIKKQIVDQLNKLEHVIFANYTHEPAVRLSKYLTSLFSGKLTKVFFTDNGSSAVEAAIKMAFQYWINRGKPEKNRFAYVRGAYHGETLGALALGDLDLYKKMFQTLLHQSICIEGPDCYRCPWGLSRDRCDAECFTNTRMILEQHHRSLASVIIEPVLQAAAGMRMYSPIFLKKLRKACDELEIKLIADEIATGFGRTGKMMASDHVAMIPDLVTLSKGLTGGFLPLAAVLAKEEIFQAFYGPYTDLKAFMHSHSYTGNPLACRAACAVWELLQQEGFWPRIVGKGQLIADQVQDLNSHPQVGEIRSLGMVTAIELVADRQSRKSFDWKKRIGYRIYRTAEQNGVLLRNLGDIIYFFPPLVIEEPEIVFMTQTAKNAIFEILSQESS